MSTSPNFCQLKKVLPDSNNFLYEFDENGNLIKCNGYDPFKDDEESYKNSSLLFERDKQGYITRENIICFEGADEYSWKDGRVAKCTSMGEGGCTYWSYVYDENGQLVSRSGKFEEPMGDGDDYGTQSYSYLTHDEYGNWTKRKEEYKWRKSGDNSSEVVTRSITYYPINL